MKSCFIIIISWLAIALIATGFYALLKLWSDAEGQKDTLSAKHCECPQCSKP